MVRRRDFLQALLGAGAVSLAPLPWATYLLQENVLRIGKLPGETWSRLGKCPVCQEGSCSAKVGDGSECAENLPPTPVEFGVREPGAELLELRWVVVPEGAGAKLWALWYNRAEKQVVAFVNDRASVRHAQRYGNGLRTRVYSNAEFRVEWKKGVDVRDVYSLVRWQRKRWAKATGVGLVELSWPGDASEG